MKLNNKGFAISSIMYIILIFSLVLVITILGMLSSRKMTLDAIKKHTLSQVKDNLNDKKYKIGDKIKIDGENYYVIANSPLYYDYVTLLKELPLTVNEVENNKIGSDGINHVNRYSRDSIGTPYNQNRYGAIAYYSSEQCGWYAPTPGSINTNGCESENATNYATSDIKYIVDNWANNKFAENVLKTVDGYKARLITSNELTNNLNADDNYNNLQYSWVHSPINGEYWKYWTMNQMRSPAEIATVGPNYIYALNVFTGFYPSDSAVVRPVINVYKSALE